jgi:hypothetical protein
MTDGPDYKPTPVVGMPAQPATVALEKPPAWAIALTEKVVTGFSRMDARMDTMESNLELQGGSLVDVGKRMTTLETRVGNIEERQNTGSLRVKQESQTNLNQDAAIAQIITEQAEAKKRDEATQAALAKNTDLTQKGVDLAKTAAKNPVVLALLIALASYVTSWLGHHTP